MAADRRSFAIQLLIAEKRAINETGGLSASDYRHGTISTAGRMGQSARYLIGLSDRCPRGLHAWAAGAMKRSRRPPAARPTTKHRRRRLSAARITCSRFTDFRTRYGSQQPPREITTVLSCKAALERRLNAVLTER